MEASFSRPLPPLSHLIMVVVCFGSRAARDGTFFTTKCCCPSCPTSPFTQRIRVEEGIELLDLQMN